MTSAEESNVFQENLRHLGWRTEVVHTSYVYVFMFMWKLNLTKYECYRTKYGHFSRPVQIILAVLTVCYSKTEHLLSLCIDLLICGLKKHERRFIKADCQSCICFWMKTWTEMSLMLWCLYSMSGADEGPYLLDIHWLKAKLCLRCIPLDKPAIFPLDSSIEAGTAFASCGSE